MINFNELRIAPGEPLHTDKWNGLIDRVGELPITIDPNGNKVGVGIADPQAKLHIDGDLQVDGDLRIPDDHKFKIGPWEIRQSGGGDDTSYLHIDRWSGDIHQPDRLRVDWSGNVQLNGSLSCKRGGGALNIEGDTHVYIQFFPLGISKGRKGWFGYGSPRGANQHKMSIVNQNKAPLALATSNKDRLLIDSNGKVGIGTDSPSSELHLVGQLTIDHGPNRGYIIMRGHANDEAAKRVLNRLGKHQLIIGGCWDDEIYFYWKDNGGKNRRLKLRGTHW